MFLVCRQVESVTVSTGPSSLPGVDAVDGVADVLAPKHCGTEAEQHDHSGRPVESEHRSVDLDTAHLQQARRTIRYAFPATTSDKVQPVFV